MKQNYYLSKNIRPYLAALSLMIGSVTQSVAIPTSLGSPMVNHEQQSAKRSITGVVKDAKGEAIIGASIKVSNSTNGAQTNIDGQFTLNNVTNNDILEVSSIGYVSQKIKVGSQNTLTITLKEDVTSLDEVVVVGFGKQKKVNLTGSVATVKAENLISKPSTSLTNSLQGAVPGVTVTSRPGDVGNDMGSVNVRGRGNLGSAAPLYVVDGVPVSAGEFQRIYPGDIKTISILRDAAASSIYGSRAAYGVFLVTTKQGEEGKATISYNGYMAWQTPTILPKKVNSEDFAMLKNEANVNAGKKPEYDNETLNKIKAHNSPDLYPDNDWYKLLYRDYAPMTEHNISISGGGKTRYFVSGTFYEQQSLIPHKALDRYSFRANTERDFTSFLTLGTNISYVSDKIDEKGTFYTTDLNRMSPLSVAKHSDGSWGSVTAGTESKVYAENNPLRKLEEYGYSNSVANRLNAALTATLKPIDGLEIKGIFSYRKYDESKTTFTNRVPAVIGFISKEPIAGTQQDPNEMKKQWDNSHTLMSQIYGTYTKAWGKHDISLMMGMQYESYENNRLKAGRKDFPTNNLSDLNAGSAKAENLSNEGYKLERAFLSQFMRFNYSYNSKYLFESNVRFDRSSQFAKSSRLGIFPSFSGAWRISEEGFMKDITWVNNLKFRVSWGELGNVDNVGYYDFMDGLAIGANYISNGAKQDGAWPSKEPNDKLKWETVSMFNFGIDATLFRGLDIQLDIYNKNTRDILLSMPKPYELGLDEDSKNLEWASINAGKVNNKGIELNITYRGNVGDLSYEVGGNLSKVWNKIVSLNGLNDQINGDFIFREGEAIGSFFGYKANGLFKDDNDLKNHILQDKQTKPGDIKYVDVNGDQKFSAEDRTIIGNDVPYFNYGLSMSAQYKGFDFSVQGQGVKDVKVHLHGEEAYAFFNGASAKEFHKSRWTKENPNPSADYPRILPTTDDKHNERFSSFWLFNADYFRIKNLTLGYTLPQHLSKKIYLNRLRVYLSGTNLFTIRGDKRMKDFDPEVPSSRGSYPNTKDLSMGVNLSF
ncbi:TonB-dependent receptor [Porphyromonas pogonae]|uniref:SusC/RagA family TonB-linked outer membrane protein n=1 Tax=Porphyromonas pogonae TaxID=867595 RepID=UPI002E78EB59|nr:TonB-dependent receptor [Porphyromonas pogonae]